MAWAGAILVLPTGVRFEHHRSRHGFVSFTRWWIWMSQCLGEILLQDADDDVLEVVDVPLIWLNS
jgi:hypothetical protein